MQLALVGAEADPEPASTVDAIKAVANANDRLCLIRHPPSRVERSYEAQMSLASGLEKRICWKCGRRVP
jgi:hypothetical protein